MQEPDDTDLLPLSRPPPSALPFVPKKKETRIKILSAGDAGVGKSCLIKRYCEERYVTTIGVDYGVKRVSITGKEGAPHDIQVHFWDLGGHPSFLDVRNEFYKHAQGIIVVFSVMSRGTFTGLAGWLDEIARYTPDPLIFICANKVDEKGERSDGKSDGKKGGKRVVSEQEARAWAESRHYLYFETSAYSGEGVALMFETLFASIIEHSQKG